MTRHPGSIDVVSFVELLPEYAEVMKHPDSATSIRMYFDGNLEEDLNRYRNNRYFEATADRLSKSNGTYDSHGDGEEVVQFLSGDFKFMQVGTDEIREELKNA